MINQRLQRDRYKTSDYGFVIARKNQEYDFCVRLLGAGKGPLAIFDEPKTTTANIKCVEGHREKILNVLQQIELTEEDFKFHVSVPYIDVDDFCHKIIEKHQEIYGEENA